MTLSSVFRRELTGKTQFDRGINQNIIGSQLSKFAMSNEARVRVNLARRLNIYQILALFLILLLLIHNTWIDTFNGTQAS